MASIGEDIRTFIIASTGVQAVFSSMTAPGAVEQNTIRQEAPSPRIWFQRDSENEELDLGNVGGLVESIWTLEVHTTGDDQRFDIADAVKERMNGHIGAFGSRSVQSVKIEDHDDDYIPRGIGSEEGFFVAAMSATIWFAN